MTGFEVLLTAGATRDLEELYRYVAEHDSPLHAEQLLNRIERTMETLATLPDRGAHPRELLELGVRDYRQVFFKPYRVLYRIIGPRAYVYLIVDGRRNMQTPLQQRLLGA